MATPKNDNFRILANKSADDKYLRLGRFAYASIQEANDNIPIPERHPGLQVWIGDQLHAYTGALSNTELLPLNIYQLNLSGNGSYTHKAGTWLVGFAIKATSLITNLGIAHGSRVAASGMRIDPNDPWWEIADYSFYSDVDTTFNFTGVTSPITIRIFKK